MLISILKTTTLDKAAVDRSIDFKSIDPLSRPKIEENLDVSISKSKGNVAGVGVERFETPKKSTHLKVVTFDNIFLIYYFKDNEDRKGYWIENKCHFQRRCDKIQETISFVFQNSHRYKIQKLIDKWEKFNNK
jgi:hypothetical protein